MTTEEILKSVKEIETVVEKIYKNYTASDVSLSDINNYTRQLSLLGILSRAQALEKSILKGEQ